MVMIIYPHNKEHMQNKSLIINDEKSNKDLNDHLMRGWKVCHLCPMPSSCSIAIPKESIFTKDINNLPTCLVIIQKD
jgi:hypothetical protein